MLRPALRQPVDAARTPCARADPTLCSERVAPGRARSGYAMDKDTHDERCSSCGGPLVERQLFSSAVMLCPACEPVTRSPQAAAPAGQESPARPEPRCDYCGTPERAAALLVVHSQISICDACLRIVATMSPSYDGTTTRKGAVALLEGCSSGLECAGCKSRTDGWGPCSMCGGKNFNQGALAVPAGESPQVRLCPTCMAACFGVVEAAGLA